MPILITDWDNFDRALPLAQSYGLGLEIHEFIDPRHIDQPDDFIARIQPQVKSLPVLSLHGPFSELVPASRDSLVRQVVWRRFNQAYKLAQRLGASHLIFHSGYYPKTYPTEQWIESTLAFWLDFMGDKLQPDLIHVENVYEDDFSPLAELIDRVNQALGANMLTVNLDIGHANANSSHGVEAWITGLADRIRYAHLHNNGGVTDDHWRLDRGSLDVAKVLELLRQHAPQATWTVETLMEDIQPSLEWLVGHGYL